MTACRARCRASRGIASGAGGCLSGMSTLGLGREYMDQIVIFPLVPRHHRQHAGAIPGSGKAAVFWPFQAAPCDAPRPLARLAGPGPAAADGRVFRTVAPLSPGRVFVHIRLIAQGQTGISRTASISCISACKCMHVNFRIFPHCDDPAGPWLRISHNISHNTRELEIWISSAP